jgi:hypothetical protein
MGRTYWCKRLHTRRDVASTAEQGDSTVMTEYREDRDTYLSPLIPLTGIAREDIEFLETRKAWLVGRSQDAVATVSTHSVGQAVLVSTGTDYRGQLIAASKQRSLKDQDRAAAAASAKPAPTKGTTAKPPPSGTKGGTKH